MTFLKVPTSAGYIFYFIQTQDYVFKLSSITHILKNPTCHSDAKATVRIQRRRKMKKAMLKFLDSYAYQEACPTGQV